MAPSPRWGITVPYLEPSLPLTAARCSALRSLGLRDILVGTDFSFFPSPALLSKISPLESAFSNSSANKYSASLLISGRLNQGISARAVTKKLPLVRSVLNIPVLDFLRFASLDIANVNSLNLVGVIYTGPFGVGYSITEPPLVLMYLP